MITTTYDRLLVNPTADDLVGALGEAARTANDAAAGSGAHGRAAVPADAEAWARWARRRQRPEGTRRWRGTRAGAPAAAHVVVAWWTDAIGRRHVRVRG